MGKIAEYFPALGIDLVLEVKTDWELPGSFSVEKWPVASQMQRYIDNVRAIKNAFSISVALPSTMEKLTWRNANNIEKVLTAAASRAANMVQIFRYSGEIYSGEE